ncbi:MAG: hypothetical protein H8E35_14950 [Ardenticatenia bacterium]|nr:hypothetical protein [Ardenticatenia bacterium]
MLKHEGNRIGDAWFYVHDEIVHCYYLTCPEEIPAHVQWDIGHATSRNLVDWEVHDLALRRGEKGTWDDGLATGSILERQGRFWMAYTGHHTQQVGLAVSDDLYTWEKQPQNPVTAIDERFYEAVGSGERKQPHWRDPFLFEHEGCVYHWVCASRNDGPECARAAFGLARSRDMVDWEVLPPPKTDRFAQEFECPQLYEKDGLWYAVFSSGPKWFSVDYLYRIGGPKPHFMTYSLVSPSPMGPFTIHGTGQILPTTSERQPYACQLVTLKGKTFLLGTQLDGICDPIPVEFDSDGIHASKEVPR